MNNEVFGKTMKNVRNHRDIKLIRIEAKSHYLVSEPNYDGKKKIMNIYCRNEKNYNVHEITVYLDLSILELSKIVKYEFWYGYLKLKCGRKAKLCYMDRDSFTQK